LRGHQRRKVGQFRAFKDCPIPQSIHNGHLEDSSSWGGKRKGLTRKSQPFSPRNPFQIKVI
jgi:hypothetical protein